MPMESRMQAAAALEHKVAPGSLSEQPRHNNGALGEQGAREDASNETSDSWARQAHHSRAAVLHSAEP